LKKCRWVLTQRGCTIATGKSIEYEHVSSEVLSERVAAIGLPPIIGQEMTDNYAAFNEVGCK